MQIIDGWSTVVPLMRVPVVNRKDIEFGTGHNRWWLDLKGGVLGKSRPPEKNNTGDLELLRLGTDGSRVRRSSTDGSCWGTSRSVSLGCVSDKEFKGGSICCVTWPRVVDILC